MDPMSLLLPPWYSSSHLPCLEDICCASQVSVPHHQHLRLEYFCHFTQPLIAMTGSGKRTQASQNRRRRSWEGEVARTPEPLMDPSHHGRAHRSLGGHQGGRFR